MQGKSWKGCAVSSKSKKGCFCPLASSSSTAQGPLSRRVLVPSLSTGYLITLLAVDLLLKGNLPCADAFLPRVHSQARLWAQCTRSVPCLTPLQPRFPSSPGAQIAPSTDGIDPTFPAPPQALSTPDACLSPSPVIPVRRAPVNLTTLCALTLAFPDVERRSTREGTPGYPEASERHQVLPAHISQVCLTPSSSCFLFSIVHAPPPSLPSSHPPSPFSFPLSVQFLPAAFWSAHNQPCLIIRFDFCPGKDSLALPPLYPSARPPALLPSLPPSLLPSLLRPSTSAPAALGIRTQGAERSGKRKAGRGGG
jgi:hypothetical protein